MARICGFFCLWAACAILYPAQCPCSKPKGPKSGMDVVKVY